MKKEKKKFGVGKIILTIIIVVPLLCIVGWLVSYNGEIDYALSEDGTFYAVIGVTHGPVRKMTEVNIPEYHDGLPVKVICGDAFGWESDSEITSITLPDTLIAIGSGAFEGTAIYKDDASWEIEYKIDANGNKVGELYRALYIDGYLIEVRYNDETIDNDDSLPRYSVNAGTLGIAHNTFKSTNSGKEYTSASIVIESNDLAFVGTRVYRSAEGVNFGFVAEGERSLYSIDMFQIDCEDYHVYYDGLMEDWVKKFEHRGSVLGNHTAYWVHCNDGTISPPWDYDSDD